MTTDDIKSKLQDCIDVIPVSNTPFSKWEESFIESVAEFFEDKGYLTEKQEEHLLKIWEKI